jgi:hypothetical protein
VHCNGLRCAATDAAGARACAQQRGGGGGGGAVLVRMWAGVSRVVAQRREETSALPVLMWPGKAPILASISDRGEGCGWAEHAYASGIPPSVLVGFLLAC